VSVVATKGEVGRPNVIDIRKIDRFFLKLAEIWAEVVAPAKAGV
jgi:hypothetical protein